jgi:hypothetical protein
VDFGGGPLLPAAEELLRDLARELAGALQLGAETRHARGAAPALLLLPARRLAAAGALTERCAAWAGEAGEELVTADEVLVRCGLASVRRSAGRELAGLAGPAGQAGHEALLARVQEARRRAKAEHVGIFRYGDAPGEEDD